MMAIIDCICHFSRRAIKSVEKKSWPQFEQLWNCCLISWNTICIGILVVMNVQYGLVHTEPVINGIGHGVDKTLAIVHLLDWLPPGMDVMLSDHTVQAQSRPLSIHKCNLGWSGFVVESYRNAWRREANHCVTAMHLGSHLCMLHVQGSQQECWGKFGTRPPEEWSREFMMALDIMIEKYNQYTSST